MKSAHGPRIIKLYNWYQWSQNINALFIIMSLLSYIVTVNDNPQVVIVTFAVPHQELSWWVTRMTCLEEFIRPIPLLFSAWDRPWADIGSTANIELGRHT